MRLTLSPADEAYRDELRAFYAATVEPGWRRYGEDYDALGRYLHDWDRTLAAGGWAVPNWPAEYGGRDATAVQRAIFTEETARFDAPEGLGRLGKRLVGPVLMGYGTPAQKEHLARIRSGDEVWAQGFSEPDAGSDLVNLTTRAVRDGDEWVINGRKIWTSFAQFAQYVMLLARTGPPGSRDKGISVFLVDLSLPGIDVRPIKTIAGKSEFNEVFLDDVRIPADALVGGENEGWPIVQSVLRHERGAEFCLARYSDIRRITTGLAASAVGFPGPLGALYARVFAIQLVATDLLRHEQREAIPPGLESLVKLYTTETWRTLGEAQVAYWGRDGFDAAGPTALDDWYESRHYTISAGTSEIQRNSIASRLLKLPRGAR